MELYFAIPLAVLVIVLVIALIAVLAYGFLLLRRKVKKEKTTYAVRVKKQNQTAKEKKLKEVASKLAGLKIEQKQEKEVLEIVNELINR